jgi:hypothetical protein
MLMVVRENCNCRSSEIFNKYLIKFGIHLLKLDWVYHHDRECHFRSVLLRCPMQMVHWLDSCTGVLSDRVSKGPLNIMFDFKHDATYKISDCFYWTVIQLT